VGPLREGERKLEWLERNGPTTNSATSALLPTTSNTTRPGSGAPQNDLCDQAFVDEHSLAPQRGAEPNPCKPTPDPISPRNVAGQNVGTKALYVEARRPRFAPLPRSVRGGFPKNAANARLVSHRRTTAEVRPVLDRAKQDACYLHHASWLASYLVAQMRPFRTI